MSDLRQGFYGKESRAGPWDALVIGSGAGSMAAAALLAHAGSRVLVLEQHYVPGGFTHTFTRRQYRWDVGVHAVGEMGPGSEPGRLVSALTDGALEWSSLGPVYDAFHYPDGLNVDYPDNPTAFRENLLAAFPRERAAIDRYLALATQIGDGLRGYYLSKALPRALGSPVQRLTTRRMRPYLTTSTRAMLASLTHDERLRAVLGGQWGYCGAVPSRSAFAMTALVTKHFLWGGWYPKGGSARLASSLLGAVAARGGWTRVMADVKRVLVERGRAVGVELADGEQLRAPKILSGIGALSTLTLLPAEVQRASWAASLRTLRPAPAHVCLYLGFKGDLRGAGARGANEWFYDTWDTEHEAWRVSPDGELPRAPALYVSFPSLKDPLHARPRSHTGEVVTFVPWEAFAGWADQRWRRRGDAYEAFKRRLTDSLLAQLFARMPALKPLLDYAELSTPVTTDHFVRPTHGSIYGLEPSPERFANPHLRARTPVPGLYLAGSDVGSVGVLGAVLGGVLAAVAAEPWATVNFLRRV